ncbi:MAG: flagellar biosynthesis protein FliQ [Proteobacteria bacterium]|uniref:flagellar biosynthesis protein FliQ n=1 Tax=Thauera sp. 2A1 TaxID=2570191 RepID=UPI0012920855|nr:flagellar biosynthesis protein FliQ [Thauera sp. 2A1]KAI5916126.1 flagellar biosynthesis protein FliQ [Thauera sp. 2A1]MBS0510630.1 flagellar biosynthesis protein FliQ [Pseudomonadota bacterium]MBS0545800.1 flagellar biosynthesis protein FliQ [Pseudomonadota bacterium]MBS0555208.1 flagellar biosynthesis protein FliQ [Pseudomonadota bacterium]
MTPTAVVELGRQAIEITLLVSAPLFIAALVTGLVVSIFQAATQINEMTLSFVPKIVVMFVTLVVAGPWMITTLTDFMRRLFESIPAMIG